MVLSVQGSFSDALFLPSNLSSISPSNEYSELISLKIDLFNLTIKGTLRALLQHHSSVALRLLYSPVLTTTCDYWEDLALTIWTFVGRVMSLIFNTLSRFVLAFLQRSKCLLILFLQSPSSDFRAREEEIGHYFPVFPLYLP